MNAVQTGADRTARAVVAQLQAMGCERYEIGVRDPVSGLMMPRTWSPAEVEQGVSWLKRVNAKGNDIYIRPAGSLGLILVDDLTAPSLARMKGDGLAPAVVIETSPANYQAWLRVSQQPVPPEQATAAARIVAARYGGDPNSADFRHFGRLAGYTNRKPGRRRADGMQPYVLVHEASGAVAEQAAQLLADAEVSMRATLLQAESAISSSGPRSAAGTRTPAENYAFYAGRIMTRYPDTDYSRLDWMVSRDIASANLAVDEQYLEQALRAGSPRLAERKVGHLDEYVARTARKVMQDPRVTAAREHLAHPVSPEEARLELGGGR